MTIISLIKRFKYLIMRHTDPIGYAKKIGVNFPDGELHLYEILVGVQNHGL